MIIEPIRKNILSEYKVRNLDESVLREIIREEINEVLGAFKKQYEIGDICARAIKTLVKSLTKEQILAIRSGVLDFPYHIVKVKDSDISGVKIKIKQFDVRGQTIGINPEENLVLVEIGINSAIRLPEKELSDTFAHELMHGNVFLKRYKDNKETYDRTPEYYGNLTKVFRNYYGTLAYNFAHALYACFYQETNALVSQVYSSIMMEIGESVVDEKTFMDIYTNTNSYQEYNIIITETLPLIKQMSDENIQKTLVVPFKNCGINFNVRGIRKECKRIEKVANDAIKKCGRNASLCYNDLLERGQIKE